MPPARRGLWAAGLLILLALGAALWWTWLRPRTEPPGMPAVPSPPALTLSPRGFGDLAGWAEDRHDRALTAFQRSCAVLLRRADTAPLGPDPRFGAVGDWRSACAGAMQVPPGDRAAARAFFERAFLPVAVNDDAPGLFTGYYEPELRGSRRHHGRYQTPLLARPADLVMVDLGDFRTELAGQRLAGRVVDGRLVPYPSRAEIEAGALPADRLALLWVDDPIDAFFLHIQGSGRVRLDSGEVIRLGYAAQNGHPYTAIGRTLIARGALAPEEVTMQSIRVWLKSHPEAAAEVMNSNASYVFFAEQAIGDPVLGAPGAQGVPLTPGRSLAVDRALYPLGLPFWLDATVPAAGDGEMPLHRLVVAQDTGGAIRGAVRGDLYWGFGDEAAARAGRMKHQGRFHLLLPAALTARLGPPQSTAEESAAAQDRAG